MSEFVFDEHAIQERCRALPDNQLVAWLFVFERMLQFDKWLRNLEASFVGQRAPDAELAAAQAAIKAELQIRTIAKGGRQA